MRCGLLAPPSSAAPLLTECVRVRSQGMGMGMGMGMMGMGGMSMGMVSRPFCTKRKADPDHPSELSCAAPPVLRSRRLSLR